MVHQDFSHVQQFSNRNYLESLLRESSREFWNRKAKIKDLRAYYPGDIGISIVGKRPLLNIGIAGISQFRTEANPTSFTPNFFLKASVASVVFNFFVVYVENIIKGILLHRSNHTSCAKALMQTLEESTRTRYSVQI